MAWAAVAWVVSRQRYGRYGWLRGVAAVAKWPNGSVLIRRMVNFFVFLIEDWWILNIQSNIQPWDFSIWILSLNILPFLRQSIWDWDWKCHMHPLRCHSFTWNSVRAIFSKIIFGTPQFGFPGSRLHVGSVAGIPQLFYLVYLIHGVVWNLGIPKTTNQSSCSRLKLPLAPHAAFSGSRHVFPNIVGYPCFGHSSFRWRRAASLLFVATLDPSWYLGNLQPITQNSVNSTKDSLQIDLQRSRSIFHRQLDSPQTKKGPNCETPNCRGTFACYMY